MCYHGPNIVSYEIITILTCTQLVGAYIPLSKLKHLPDLEEALKRFKEPIILGDLNVYPNEGRIPRSQKVADLLAEYSLVDLARHFHQRRRLRYLKTWPQVQQGTVLRSRYD